MKKSTVSGLILLLSLSIGCDRSVEAPVVPSASNVAVIEIYEGSLERDQIILTLEDEQVISDIIDVLGECCHEWYVSWHTTPVPQHTALFKSRDGQVLYVLWFGPEWMGGDDAVADSAYSRMARVTRDDLSKIRSLLGIGV